ncbi:hypothetical protein F2Q68_00039635 [Brassica cretica]|uniref:Uncharacterized protein n=1 Tax=Brassica cretica TaxID=69181 RepID=A0A8S9MH80_BRACR|nr:hypothetical protein F2Q68_00039635 [Brassica cretica]
MLIPFAMGVVTSFPFPKVSSPESKPIGVGLPEASQGDVRPDPAEKEKGVRIFSYDVWHMISCSHNRGEVTAAKGFNAGGMYDGLRASEEKPDLDIVTCDVDAVPADN